MRHALAARSRWRTQIGVPSSRRSAKRWIAVGQRGRSPRRTLAAAARLQLAHGRRDQRWGPTSVANAAQQTRSPARFAATMASRSARLSSGCRAGMGTALEQRAGRRLVEGAAAHETHGRDQHALLGQAAASPRASSPASSRRCRPGVRGWRRRRRAHASPSGEDRRHHRHVGQMRAAREGIVGDEDVARRRVREARARTARTVSLMAPRCTGMWGALATRPAPAVEHRAGVVEPLLDVRGDRGVAEHRAHLLGDRHEAVAEHLEPHRVRHVGGRRRRPPGRRARPRSRQVSTSTPSPSTTSEKPGSTTTVPVSSSTIAGPASRCARRQRLPRVDGGGRAPDPGKPRLHRDAGAAAPRGPARAAAGSAPGAGPRTRMRTRRSISIVAVLAHVAEAALVLVGEGPAPVEGAGGRSVVAHRKRRVGSAVAQVEPALDAHLLAAPRPPPPGPAAPRPRARRRARSSSAGSGRAGRGQRRARAASRWPSQLSSATPIP